MDVTTGGDEPEIEVLLVEDSAPVRAELGRRLEDDPRVATVTAASSLRDARSVLDRRSFDLWVLDFQLGDGTALELLRDDPGVPEPVPVVVVTSHVSSHVRELCLDAGADVFLDKWEAAGQLRTLVGRFRSPRADAGPRSRS